ncbi:MAG: hypothetical protein KJ592_05235 [Nanoarchaeota archaeon]|nr:hypothetical protein [Nanoarchaeota archaeon]
MGRLDIIFECAVEGGVDYIISNDKHLLKVVEFEGIKIIRPEEFLRIIDKDNLRR